jgi:NAD(P)-dependent dehydrogenase (short-subunit alcohol dehydrogenase family)
MSAGLNGSTALVTGSTSGIGRATAAALAAEGAHVIVSGRDAARGEQVVADIREAGGKADFVAADLGSAAGARALAEQATAVTGRIDILVNNAGIYTFGPTEDITEEVFDEMYAVNVKAPFFLVGQIAPAMATRGTGSIVNITTAGAVKGLNGASAYGSSKAAVNQLTRVWAAEYGPRGVRVNTVSPGPVRTPGTEDMLEVIDGIAQTTPAGRVGRPEEIASAVVYLTSDGASYVHGTTIDVDGGAAAV